MVSPLIVARCGDVQNAPESTLAAFRSAIERGAGAIEFDVHRTADGALVVHHDYYLGRTERPDRLGDRGRTQTCQVYAQDYIGDYTLAALQELDVGSWFDPAFAGARMPTLSEVLALGQGRVRFEIDMRTPDLDFLEAVLAEIVRFDVVDDVELTSSHVPLLARARQMAPHVRTGLFVRPWPDWMAPALGRAHVLGWMELLEARVAHLPASLLDMAFVRQLHAQGYLVHGANLNTEEEMALGCRVGVDQFSTDRLELALDVRRRM